MQTDATTPNIVGPTIVGVVTFVLAVVCKRMQQLPTMLGPAVHRGKDTTHKNMETCWKSCANGYNIAALHFGDHRTKEMLGVVGSNAKRLTGFKPCSTTPNKTQEHVTGFANGPNIFKISNNFGSCWPTMLRPFVRAFSNYSKSAR